MAKIFEEHTATIPAIEEIPASPSAPRRMTLNMGPQHPSTHGVLRIVLELEGETIRKAIPDIGFLHTGIEKECEQKNWQQVVTLTDRVDYLSNLANNLVYCLAVEKLLQLEIPPRAQWTRVMLTELSRLNSHLVWLGTHALDIGAMSMFFYCFCTIFQVKNLCCQNTVSFFKLFIYFSLLLNLLHESLMREIATLT